MSKALAMASLGLNLIVLAPVCWGLLADRAWARAAFGPRQPSRDILTAVYLAIAAASAALLAMLLRPDGTGALGAVACLLGLQVAYKLATVVLVADGLRNPVVISNLIIAAAHSVTLAALLRA